MRRPTALSGYIRCSECRSTWDTTWNTQAPKLICHLCGGDCLPVGPQLVTVAIADAIDGELFRLERLAMLRAQS